MDPQFPLNKQKIINDPVYGFINIPFPIVFDLIEHPWFQRLRRIRQLGMTHMVYPGANHTRFQHALGAMHLMGSAIEIIRSKGHPISDKEAEAVTIAILLHDIGHGPFSHSLEQSLIQGTGHEEVSRLIMDMLNEEFNGRLELAIRIFRNSYHKKFLHQLVSSQLDMDRLDYLKRDSFFTGVTEGVIGSDRIIKMLNVIDDELVVDQKGIYSIEKFLIARRLMFWQVYLHKTVIAADQLLIKMLKRARELAARGTNLFATPALSYFLYDLKGKFAPENREEFLERFLQLDDNDIICAAKVWRDHNDSVLSNLCRGFIERRLFRIELQASPFPDDRIADLRKQTMNCFGVTEQEAHYLVISETISNNAYSALDDRIRILGKEGTTRDVSEASDMLNIAVLSKTVRKFFLCYPKSFKDLS